MQLSCQLECSTMTKQINNEVRRCKRMDKERQNRDNTISVKVKSLIKTSDKLVKEKTIKSKKDFKRYLVESKIIKYSIKR